MSDKAVFTSGSTMRHVVVMTLTSATGLMALFLVDALNLLYISLLGVTELAAAIGFAGAIQFFMLSVSIGLMIAGQPGDWGGRTRARAGDCRGLDGDDGFVPGGFCRHRLDLS